MGNLISLGMDQLIIFGAMTVLILILFFMNLSNSSKIKKLKAKYNKFMNGLGEGDIEGVLEDCMNKIDGVIIKNKEIEYQVNNIERNMYYCVQKLAVVRYSAFDNVGSDLSFSIALMDNNDDGLVLSSLYSREGASVYAKPISNGKSKYALSAEEIQAIDTAKKINMTGLSRRG